MNKSIYTNEHKIIIKRLKIARLALGLNQKQVSEKLGKTQSYISKIESGQRRLDIPQLRLFSEIYKKNLDFFFRND